MANPAENEMRLRAAKALGAGFVLAVVLALVYLVGARLEAEPQLKPASEQELQRARMVKQAG